MSDAAVVRRLRIAAASALATLCAVGATFAAVSHRPIVLPDYGQVPPFALIDQRGEPITEEQLRGRLWIADFIFTRCAGQCPMMSRQMSRLARRVDPSVTLVSFSVDPAWDTPEVLSRYAARYDAPAAWRFATGNTTAIEQLCREGFHLAAEGGGPATLTHSQRLVLVDRDGHIRGYYDAADPEQVRRLDEHVRLLLKRRAG